MSEENVKRNTARGPMGGGPMGGVVEKPKNFKVTMTKLLGYCKSYLPVIIIALVAAAAATVLQIIGPDKLKDLTNEVMKGLPILVKGSPVVGSIAMDAVAKIAWIVVIFYAIAFLLNYIQSYMMATVTQTISKKMRTDISQKVNRLPLKYFDSTSYGDVLSRVTNDVDAIGQTLNQSIGTLITSITMFVGALIMMFYNNWLMALTAVASSLIGFVLMMTIMKKSQKYFKSQPMELGTTPLVCQSVGVAPLYPIRLGMPLHLPTSRMAMCRVINPVRITPLKFVLPALTKTPRASFDRAMGCCI